MSDTLLACDAGQSSTRIRHEGEGWVQTLPGVRTDRPLGAQLVERVTQVVHDHPDLTERGFDVAIGSSGATDTEDALAPARAMHRLGLRRLWITHDSTTSYLGALGDRCGVVTAAGTGVITFAVGFAAVARVDGWGWLLGDDGSAFWLGREGMRAVLRAHDGRGPATVLSESIGTEFDDIEQAYLQLHADPNKVARIAGWAAQVSLAAEAGDEVSMEICRQAGAQLACSTATGLRRVGLGDEDSPVALLGGVMRSTLIRKALEIELERLAPRAQIVEPIGEGLEGAAALPAVDPRSALGRRVSRADVS